MKIGFFGGSFNPPTKAHIELAQKVIEKYVLDKVIFVPMGDFYVKEGLASSKDRLNMLKLACKPYDYNGSRQFHKDIRVEREFRIS